MSLRRIAGGLVWLALMGSLPGSLWAQGRALTPARFSFVFVGDLPADVADEKAALHLLETFDTGDARFILHSGNVKGRNELCSDALYEQRKALLATSRKALVLVPGNSDWLDCDSAAAGGFDALERLTRLRELFFDGDAALGQERLAVTRQSEMAKYRAYPENVRWITGPVMFVGLNLPGRNNNFRIDAGRNAEFDDRAIASRAWLERAFQAAQRARLAGLVILVNADPQFELRPRRVGRDGYQEFKSMLRELCRGFGGEVLLLHGAGALARQDQPLRDAGGKVIANFTRVAPGPQPVAASGMERSTLRIRVDARRPRLFQVSRQPPG